MACLPFLIIVLLMNPGVFCQNGWGVTYSSSHICALKDSTVTINCTYKYPPRYKITEVFWTKVDSSDPPDLSKDSEYSERIQYLGHKQHACSVRLTDVRETDSHEYYFRFITDRPEGKWTGAPGVTLEITDLQVESEGERVMEGHSVTLTCKSRCSLTDTSTFIWFRNTQTLNDRNKKLILLSVRRENAGDYRCAVQGHSLTSPPRRLNVIYPPDEPVISISPSGVIVEGNSVTLTCSSESNPPATIIWFKGETYVGSGNIYIISNIRSDHSGQYKCKTENEFGQKYSAFSLNLLYPPRNVTASISSSGVIVESDSVNLTCSSESNPPANISWFKENQTSSLGFGQSFRALESGWFYCVAQNKYGSQRSAPASVIVRHGSHGHLLFGITAVCGGLLVIAIIVALIWFMMRKRRVAKSGDAAGNQQDDMYCAVKHVDLASESAHCDDVQYESVTPQRLRGEQTTAGGALESSDPEELQYATVHHHRNAEMRRSEENENHYGNITNYKPDASVRSNVEDTSVIYSSVK